MKTNRWIDGSRRFFACLLNLYPRQHRSEYAESMLQVFSDQCKDAYREKGAPGVLMLWLRILPDLGYTAAIEHLTSPQASWGLIEPVPNAPLPWKGVILVLLPGLVYLVSQVAQLIGEPWYLVVYYRAAFILILPVLVVWALTRRFPIWGLIPVGLLFRLVKEIGYQLIILHPGAFSTNPFLEAILSLARLVEGNLYIPVVVFTLLCILLAVLYFRRNRLTRSIKIWGGAFLLTAILQSGYQVWTFLDYYIMDSMTGAQKFNAVFPDMMSDYLGFQLPNNLYNITALLLLVLLGTLFTRRHGFFAIFVLVGYILPTMVVGTPWELGDSPQFLFVITPAVLIYRSLLSLIAPVWMARTQPLAGKKKAILVCIALALVVHGVMQFYPAIFNMTLTFVGSSNWYFSVLLEELLLVFAFLLGIALYQKNEPSDDTAAEVVYGSGIPAVEKI